MSTTFLFTSMKKNFMLERKCQWMNEQHSCPRVPSVCVGSECVTEITYDNWRFGLWDFSTFNTVQHPSCSNALKILASPVYVQSLAKAAIFLYSVKTVNSAAEVEHIWDLHKWYKAKNVYLNKCPRKEDIELLERMTLMSIYENYSVYWIQLA
jgi:hypothetical protein